MATIDYKQLATPEANLIELLAAQNQDGTYTAKLMGSEPFAVLAAKTIYNAYNDIEDNMAADVEGPASSTDNALARFDGTTGKLLQNSNAILTDAGALSLASNLTVSGTATFNGSSVAFANSAAPAGPNIKFENLGGSTQLSETASSSFYYKAYSHNFLSLAGTSLMALSNTGNLTVSGPGGVNATAGILRSAASGSASSGLGVEIGGGATPLLLAYNRTTPGYLPMRYHGSSHQLSVPGVCDVTLNATGNFLIGTTTDLSRLTVVKDAAGSDIGAGDGQVMIAGATNTNKRLAIGFNTTSDYGWLQAGIAGTAYKNIVLNNNGGNVLIGTTTDGGQKLQVNGTAAIAGNLTVTGDCITSSGYVFRSLGDAYLDSASTKSIFLRPAGTTALTLDTSQNATFAGTVKIANTAEIKGVYTTTTTFDFGTIANNDASSVCTLTMTGVSSSDSIIVSPTDGDNFPQFCTVSAVPTGNSVSVRLYNGSGSSRTVGSRTIRVTAIKF